MLELINLCLTFMKIGLFTIGRRCAMIPLIQSELVGSGWMTTVEVADIIAVSQMTPGPFAINAATFAGVKTAGVVGGVFATAGVVMPSLIIATLLARFFFKFYNETGVKSVMRGIRPVVTGLIAAVAVSLMVPALFNVAAVSALEFHDLWNQLDIAALVIAAVSAVAVLGLKISPIWMILLSGAAGVIIYAVL